MTTRPTTPNYTDGSAPSKQRQLGVGLQTTAQMRGVAALAGGGDDRRPGGLQGRDHPAVVGDVGGAAALGFLDPLRPQTAARGVDGPGADDL